MKITELRVDGYKNLIDCKVKLDEFNVLVGPNNSGKSNLLEVFEVLFHFCSGEEKGRDFFFRGYPMREAGSSIPAIAAYASRPLSIGLTMGLEIGKREWELTYDLRIKRDLKNKTAGFVFETLLAKPIDRTGQPTKYIERNGSSLRVLVKDHRKEHPISERISVFAALPVLYPDLKGLPSEFLVFNTALFHASLTHVLAISPEAMRRALSSEDVILAGRTSSFGLLAMIDSLESSALRRFKAEVCDILDLDEMDFSAENLTRPHGQEKGQEQKTPERLRHCYLKRKGAGFEDIREYSDGTLAVMAIVAALMSNRALSPLVCIEELENCLHPYAVERLLRFLREFSTEKQILITTHSPYLLNGVSPEDLIVALPDETGATHLHRPGNRRAVNQLLRAGHISFGDLLVTNFQEVVGS